MVSPAFHEPHTLLVFFLLASVFPCLKPNIDKKTNNGNDYAD
jgi:hypothetical protein